MTKKANERAKSKMNKKLPIFEKIPILFIQIYSEKNRSETRILNSTHHCGYTFFHGYRQCREFSDFFRTSF